MIPSIKHSETLDSLVVAFTQHLKTSGFTGDIETSYASRLAVATDNSIYQALPQAVVFPKSVADVLLLTKTANISEFQSIRFSPRGGGTGTNGQSLTRHVVIDISRHMRDIIEINVEERWVRVQTGVIKDQLNDFLRPHGFFFAPDLSTSNRATIGGMINTDASGQGSLVYGKTSDHVLGLKTVLVDGTEFDSSPLPIAEAQFLADGDTSQANIYKQLIASCCGYREQILEKFPRLNRFLTGYDLEHVYDADNDVIDASRIITGSEGTLGIVVEAKLNITPIPTFKTLVNIKYDSFESALRHAPAMVEANATSVETVDSRVLNLAKQDIIWHSVSHLISDVPGQEMDGINIVEYNNESAEEITQQLDALKLSLDNAICDQRDGVIGYQITSDLADIGKIYAMRKKAVGLLGKTNGLQKPIAFAEDTAVPPEALADFIMEFRDLLDSHQLNYGMFGHVDAGVLHVRPALDMCDPEQEVLLRTISDQVVALTAKYGGLMWGEHGRGYRTEYGPEFFGTELFDELRKVKAAFDPHNRLNPGKICAPYGVNEALVSVDGEKRGSFDRQIPVQVREEYHRPMDCNGNGLCFNYDVNSPMCPSYKATGDRRHSPKGRAGLVREWLRQLSERGVDVLDEERKAASGEVVTWSAKKQHKATAQDDFSTEVYEAMSGCLACKACTNQCPINVDVPEFKSRFLNLYHQRYPRPLKDYLVASIENTAPLMAKFPRLFNFGMSLPGVDTLLDKKIGYVDAPRLSVPSLLSRVNPRFLTTIEQLERLSAEEKQLTVAIVQDPFTSYYEAELVDTTLRFLEKLHFRPVLLPFVGNGKPQHVKGFLPEFKATAEKAAAFLNQVHDLHIPMIGLDPSLVLCYRDEYMRTLGLKRGDFHVNVLHEWLAEQEINITSNTSEVFHLYRHCTETTALPSSGKQWQKIFAGFGLTLEVVTLGCCGMAGTYGHESEHQEESKKLYAMSWKPKLAQHSLPNIVATGFSCRSQVKRFEGQKAKHPVEVLYQYL